MKRKGLMRRVLASILCASLVFQNVSVTAYATETTVEPVTEVSMEETEAPSAEKTSEEASSEKASDDVASEEALNEEALNEEASEEETSTEEKVSEETTVLETSADAKETEASDSEVSKTAEETKTSEEETVEVQETEVTEARLILSDAKLEALAGSKGLGFDIMDKFIFTEYSENESNPFGAILANIKEELFVLEGDTRNNSLKDKVTYKWQAMDDKDAFADMTADSVPAEVGVYKLVIELDESYVKAEAKEIIFAIEKAEIEVLTDGFEKSFNSGTTVAEVKERLLEAITLSDNFDMDAYLKTFDIVVRETTKTEALTDDYALIKGNDYSVDIVAELKDEYTSHYVLNTGEAINLKVENLKTTTLTITENLVEKEEKIVRTYTGQPVAEPVVSSDASNTEAEIMYKITVDGEKDEATGKDRVLDVTYDKLVKTWFNADGEALEGAPTDAGSYFFQLKFVDTEGIYDECAAQISVTVEPAKIKLIPEMSSNDEYFAGMSASEVTRNVVYTLKNTDDSPFDGFNDENKDTFWGVSYNNPEKPQSYAPVFELQRGVVTVDEQNKETTEWMTLDWDDTVDYSGPRTDADGKVLYTVKYRVVFSGKKALFNGGIPSDIDILNITDTYVNSAEKNYVVDTSDVEANAINDIVVNETANATIDVSKMLIEGMKEVSINSGVTSYHKVYDGKALYVDRAEYKKAEVKTADGTVVADKTNSKLTYTWHSYDLQYVEDADGNVYAEPVITGIEWTSYEEIPAAAGKYALKVSYYDSEHKYAAAPVYIYFEIEHQLVKLVQENAPVAYNGQNISKFTYSDKFDYKVYMIPDNDLSLAEDVTKLVEIPELSGETYRNTYYYYRPYYIDWYVTKGDNTDPAKAEYTEIEDEYDEVFDIGIPYKYGARLHFAYYDNYAYDDYADNYNDYVNYQVIEEAYYPSVNYTCVDAPVTVREAGDVKLEIKVDDSKLTETEKVYDGKAFDISDAIANGLITVTKINTDEVVPTSGDGAINLEYNWYYMDSNSEYLSDAGVYELRVSYPGDDVYAPIDEVFVAEFTINRREINITPVVNEENVIAGMNMGKSSERNRLFDDTKAIIEENYIPEDAEAFKYVNSISDAAAIYRVSKVVKDVNGDVYSKNLRTGDEYIMYYEITLDSDDLYGYNAYNYKIISNGVKFKVEKRANSSVEETYYRNIESTRLKAVYEDMSVTVTPLEGIPYAYDYLYDENGNIFIEDGGNYFIFKIIRPKEFDSVDGYSFADDALYLNSIEKAGGYVLADDETSITVAFDASEKANISFDIIWEELNGVKYTETFNVDLTNAQLEADLKTAVAPKALKLTVASKKMVVGEGQQLDVKVTKHLIDDVVFLNYEVVSGADVVSINEFGYVTALKKGTATVGVYPVKYDSQGNEVRLDFKPVTAKITVTDVTAPKISKVSASDTNMMVTYTKPADGYRREIYVMDGKKKATDFEDAIAQMTQNQGQFDGKKFIGVSENYYDRSKNIVYYSVSDLEPNSEYTVYVRNVSGIRTIADGSFVVSSAMGNVKTFKTTKVQLDNLMVSIPDAQNQNVVFGYVSKLGGYYNNVPLTQKSIQLSTYGWYKYKPQQEAADSNDAYWYPVPLSKENQQVFMSPKLTYYAFSDYVNPNTIEPQYWKNYTSPIVKINNKGKMQLKGSGVVYIRAYDSVSGIWSDAYELYISAGITAVKAKAATLKVGEPVSVYDKLTFHEGSKKLVLDELPSVVIEVIEGNDSVSVYNTHIYATKPNATAKVKVSLAEDNSIFAIMTVKTKPINSIKKLKAVNVQDEEFDLTFTHTVNKYDSAINNDFDYRITITDNRGDLVCDKLVNISNFTLINMDAKGNYTYSYCIDELVRKSSYKITVTPMYRDVAGKTATTKVTTTDIPAYSDPLLDKGVIGGMDIYHESLENDNQYGIEYGYFTSGKQYTFIADAEYPDDGRATDVLTWSSSNKKVATIKANSDSYKATFSALQPGSTIIEVKSKLRKGVVARYVVKVKAVGQMADEESGDFDVLYFDKEYGAAVEVLTEANPVRVSKNSGYDYTWVKFEAPAYGNYSFSVSSNYTYQYYYSEDESKFKNVQWVGDSDSYSSQIEFEAGETAYFKVYGTFTMSVSANKYSELTTTGSINSEESDVVMFTAPQDNYYTFEADMSDKTASVTVNGQSKGTILFDNNENTYTGYKNGLSLKKGDVVRLSLRDADYYYNVTVSYRTPVNVLSADTDMEVKELKNDETVWISFTAPVTGNYVIESKDANEEIKAEVYADITQESGVAVPQGQPALEEGATDNSKNFVYGRTFTKGETVIFRVYTESETAVTAKISVTKPSVTEVKLGEAKVINVANDGEAWVSFTADESDVKYSFKVTGEEGKEYSVYADYYLNGVKNSDNINDWFNNGYITSLKKDNVVYIKLTTDNSEANTTSANVTVSVTKQQPATEIKLDEKKALTVKNDGVNYYTFTAPGYGLYVFKSNVTANAEGTDTHTLVADRYDSVNDINPTVTRWADTVGGTNNFYKEVRLATGEEVIFAVRPGNYTNKKDNNEVTTAAEITVTKASAELTNEITIPKNSKGQVIGWYKFTSSADDNYTIAYEYKNGDKYEEGLNNLAEIRWASDLSESTSVVRSPMAIAKGETRYFKVISKNDTENDAQIKINVTNTAALVAELPTGAFEIPAGESVVYKYTVTDPGRYLVNLESKTEGVQVEAGYSTTYGTYNMALTDGAERLFTTFGQTYYIRITNNNAEKAATAVLGFSKVEATALTDGENTLTLAAGEAKWYSYTAPSTGRYNFKATVTKDGNTEEYNDVEYYTGLLTNTRIYGLDEDWFDKGYVVYIRVNNPQDTEAVIKFNASPIAAKEITANTEETIELKKNESKWFKFTADETANYTFKMNPAENLMIEDYYYLDTNNYSNYIYNDDTNVFNKQSILYIKVTRTDANEAETLSAAFTVVKENVLTLKEKTDLVITAKNGIEQYVSFTPSKSGYYAFMLKSADEGITYISSSNGLFTFNNRYDVEYRYIADTEEFNITADFAVQDGEAQTKNFTIYAEEVAPTAVGAQTDVKLTRYIKSWYSFEAPENGRYDFTVEAGNEAVKYEFYKENNFLEQSAIKAEAFPCNSYPLSKGQKLVMAVYYTDNTADKAGEAVADTADIKLKIEGIESKTITAPETEAELAAGSETWYSFTATESGKYTFEIADKQDEVTAAAVAEENRPEMILYPVNSEESTSRNFCFINEGETVYILLKNTTAEKLSFVIKYAREESVILELGSTAAVEFTAEDVANNIKEKWVIFKAPKTSNYYFGSTNLNVTYGEDGASLNTRYSLEQDEVAYISVKNNTNATASTTVSVKDLNDKSETMYSYKNISLRPYEYKYYTFTASESDAYIFSVSSGNSISLSIYDRNMGYIDYESGRNFETRVSLAEDQKVYVKVENYNSYATSVTLRAGALSDKIQTLTLDEPIYKYISSYETSYFEFTAPSAGRYEFSTYYNDGYYVDAYLYDSNWEYISDSHGSQASIVYNMYEGEKVYLEMLSDDGTDKYVIVENYDEKYQTIVKDEEVTAELKSSKNEYFVFTAAETDYYNFNFINNNDNYTYAYVYNADNSQNNYGYSFSIQRKLYAGETVNIRVYSDSDSTVSLKVTGQYSDATVLGLNTELEQSMESGKYYYYKFTASYAGDYCIYTTSDNTDEEIYTYLYDSSLNYMDDFSSYNINTLTSLEAGESIYVRIYPYGDLTRTIVVKDFEDMVQEMTLDSEYVESFAIGEYKYFGFTVPEKNMYVFSSESEEGDENTVYAELLDADMGYITSSSSTDFRICAEKVFEAGTRIYLKVNANNVTARTIKVTAVPELGLDESVTDTYEYNKYHWYKFTADTAGRYIIKIADGSNTVYTRLYNADLTDYTSKNSSGDVEYTKMFESGDTVYLRVYTSTTGEQRTITVTKTPALELDTPIEQSFEAYKYYWYEFTAPSAGMYIFNSVSGTDSSTYLNAYLYYADNLSSDKDSDYGSNFEIKHVLEADQRVYLKISSSYDATHTINVTKMPVITEEAQSFESGKNYWYEFTAPSAGMYTFYSESEDTVTGTVSAQLYDANFSSLDSNNSNTNFRVNSNIVEAGAKLYLKITTNGESETRTIKASAVPVLVLNEATEQSFEVYKYYWYEFTAPSAGMYIFNSVSGTDSSTYLNAYLYYADNLSSDKDSSNGNNFEIKHVLEADQRVYLKISSSYDATHTINVTKVPVITEEAQSFESGKTYWYEFTAPSAGVYTFYSESEDTATGTVSAQLYDANFSYLDNNNNNTNFRVNSKIVEAGAKLYLKITTNGESETRTIKASAVPMLVLNEATEQSFESGKNYWYEFTAPSAGMYIFSSESETNDSNDIDAYLYNEDDLNLYNYIACDTDYVDYNYEIKYNLEAEQKIYLRVTVDSELARTIKVSQPVALSTTETTDVTMVNNREYWYEFTAPDNGVYIFKTNTQLDDGESIEVCIYEPSENIFDCDIDRAKSLKAGDKIYLKMRAVSGDVTSTIKVSRPVVMSLDTEIEQTFETGVNYWYEFTIPEKGIYVFESESSDPYSVYITLLDKDLYYETYVNDDYCKLTTKVYEAGTKLYLLNTVQNTQTRTIKVTQIPTLSLDVATEQSFIMGKYHWYEFTAPSNGIYSFSSSHTGSDSASLKGYLYYGENTDSPVDSNQDVSDFKVKCALEAGEKAYLAVYCDTNATRSIVVNKLTTTELVTGIDTEVSLEENEVKYYEFTVAEDALYTFDFSTAEASNNLDIKVDGYSNKRTEKILDVDFSGTDYNNTMILTAGETIYIDITNQKDVEASFVLNASKTNLLEVEETQSVAADTEVWFKFTAPETGSYTFTAVQEEGYTTQNSNNNNINYYYFDNTELLDDVNEVDVDSTWTEVFRAVEGQVIYWQIINNNNTALQFSIESERVDFSLTLENPVDVSVQEDGYKWIVFEAPSSGKYWFYADSENYTDTYVYVYDTFTGTYSNAIDGGNDNGNGHHFGFTWTLEEGDHLFLKVKDYYNDAIDFTVYAELQN